MVRRVLRQRGLIGGVLMGAEYSGGLIAVTIPAGSDFTFDVATVPCQRGLVKHRAGSSDFQLSGRVPGACSNCRCAQSAQYLVDFGANVAIPTGGTVEPITVALTINGAVYQPSTMIVTPAAVEEYQNISRAIHVPVWCDCGCTTVTVRNTSAQAILAQFYNIIFAYEGVTRG